MSNPDSATYQEHLVLWNLYKISKKNGYRNTTLLADMMASDADFFMTKEIWDELISILREFDKFQQNEDKKRTLDTERGWFFWDHYRNLRDGLGVTESKQSIADCHGVSFDKVDKVIQRHYNLALEDKEPEFRKLYDELRAQDT